MRKDESSSAAQEMMPEYDFSKGVRGKYARRYAEGTNVVVLAPDLARIFPDSESVNRALRLLVEIAQRSTESEKATGSG